MNTNRNIVIWVIVIVVVILIGFWIYHASDSDSTTTTTQTTATTTSNSQTQANQGVVVGGALMTPSKDIVQNAANANNLTTLVAAVKAAGLTATLEGHGPFTVFAPTDAAFNKLPAGTVSNLLKPENKQQLIDLLQYHVVSGRYTSHDLFDGEVLGTIAGKNITIHKSASGEISINGVAIAQTVDVASSNGVSFVIDTVLTPPTGTKTK